MLVETYSITYGYAAVGLGLVCSVLLIIFGRSSSRFPPGPSGIPYVGVLLNLSPYPERRYKEWSLEEYGPVMSVKILGKNIVILNTNDTIKQAFDSESVTTSGRFDSFLFGQLQGDHGITFLDFSKFLESQKAFGMHFVKSLGTSGLDNIVNKEIDYMFKEFDSKLEEPVDIKVDLFNESANVVSMILFGRRFEYEDKVLKQFYITFEDILGKGDDISRLFLVEQMPSLRYVPPFSGANGRFCERFESTGELIKSLIEEIRNNLDKTEDISFVKHYLKEQQSKANKNSSENEFSNEQLFAYVRDVLGASMKNVANALNWLFLCVLLHPDYRKQMDEEIDKVLGKDGLPSASHKATMPLTSAFIEEMLRICSPITKTIDHKTQAETKLGEFILPKGTTISGNIWGANHDPETWPEPDKFDPLRHIGDDGKLVCPSKIIQFGVGPRSCFGENIVRLQLFLVLTRFLQRYDLSSPQDPLPTLENGFQGITYDANPFDVILKKRI